MPDDLAWSCCRDHRPRILSAEPSSWPMLRAICKAMGFVCADLWRRYGELQRSAERESPTL